MAVPIPITECIVLTMVTCVAWANYTWFHLQLQHLSVELSYTKYIWRQTML